MSGDRIDPAARTRARRRALQAAYSWEINRRAMGTVIEQFGEEQDMGIADQDYFNDLLRGIERHREALDAALEPYLERTLAQVDPIEKSMLRLAAYELIHRPDVPYRVVLNEAIAITRQFGADLGHSFVNGVLDKLAQAHRGAEYGRPL